MIQERIVVGLLDDALSEKLQLDLRLTLETAVTIAHQSDEVHKKQTVVRQKVTDLNTDLVGAVCVSKSVDEKKNLLIKAWTKTQGGSPQRIKDNRNAQGVVKLPTTADSNVLLKRLSATNVARKAITSLCVGPSPHKYVLSLSKFPMTSS